MHKNTNSTVRFPLVKLVTGLTLVIALLTSPITANNQLNLDNAQCNFDFGYHLKMKNSSITFTDENGKEINIDQDNNLRIDGSRQNLNSNQQALINDYADGIRVLIPEFRSLAVEAVNIGVTAAGMALSTLLGEDDPDFSRFNSKITEIANVVTDKINADNFDNDFDSELGAVIEDAVEEITPRLMAKVMTAALSGDESGISDIEARAKNLERDIETFVEPQAEALEARAEELCSSIDELDRIEDQMVSSGLEMMNLIEKETTNRSKKSSKHSFNFNLSD